VLLKNYFPDVNWPFYWDPALPQKEWESLSGFVSCRRTCHLRTAASRSSSPARRPRAVLADENCVDAAVCDHQRRVGDERVVGPVFTPCCAYRGLNCCIQPGCLSSNLLKPNLIRWQASLKFDIDRIISPHSSCLSVRNSESVCEGSEIFTSDESCINTVRG